MSRPRKQSDIEDNSSEQARQQIQRIQSEDQRPVSQDQNAQDLYQNQENDYQLIEELDHYQDQGVDNQQISEDYEARRNAQMQIRKRQAMDIQEEGRDEIDDLYMEDEEPFYGKYNRRFQVDRQIIGDEDQVDERRYLDAEECKGKLPEWIREEDTKKYIANKFTRFLTQFKGIKGDEKKYAIYANKIRDMVINNYQSIEVNFLHLKSALPTIALWTGLHPALVLPQLNIAAYKIAIKNYPSYQTMKPEVFIKIVGLPFVDPIRDLRYHHLGKLVQVRGVITIRSEVLNQMKKINYKCAKCGQNKGPYFISEKTQIRLSQCSSCQSNGPFLIDKQKTIYRNYQKMTIQQSPSEVLPGRIPRNKEVIAYGDNVDVARPGDQVSIIGIFDNKYDCALNVKQGFPLFSTMIEIIHICKTTDNENKQYDTYREQQFRKMAKEDNIAQKIYGSIAPSIYGHQNVKKGLTLAMFGGQSIQGTHRVRGDINVLLLGDPGIAKSQFLKSIQKVFYRCIYTTGKGASAVGLTASVKRDFSTNEWKLEAGALVLADKGICLIDQFDKMNESDRTSIHQAMQQQSISISKAGIVTSLRARCSVIAAANPNQGRYNSRLSFSDNVDLTEPILSRFDIMNVIKDEVNPELDHNLATFVINSHMKNHPYLQKYTVEGQQFLEENKENRLPYIELPILKEYIRYAREKCHPQLSQKNHSVIRNFFSELRKASKDYGGMHVSVRQIQSIIRIATAHAKLHLRSQVQKRDVDVGIKVMLQSFIQTQKSATALRIEKQFKKYFYY